MNIEALVVCVALFGFVLGWMLPVRVIWIIAPVLVLAIVMGASGADTEFPATLWLYSLLYSVCWSVVVLAGRALRRLTRSDRHGPR